MSDVEIIHKAFTEIGILIANINDFGKFVYPLEEMMEQCLVCGSTELHEQRVKEIFQIDDTPVLVENIPASVCQRCGETSFSRTTTETVRQMLHGNAKPVRALQIDVFEYA